MDAKIRRQAELADRVRDFMLTHPSDDPAYAVLLQRITTASERMRELATTHASGMTKVGVITAKLAEVRQLLVQDLLAHVGRAVKSASAAGATLQGTYTKANDNTPMLALGVIARKTLAGVQLDEVALRPHGLSTNVVPMLGAAVERHEALIVERNTRRASHVGARYGLKDALREVREATELVGSFNRLRFKRQSPELGEWKRTRQLIGAPRSTGPAPTAESDATPAK